MSIIVCIQCAMRAVVEDGPVPTFEETWEQHMTKYHPDPVETFRERQELERRIAERFTHGGFAEYVKRHT